jgi:hypothetical protein
MNVYIDDSIHDEHDFMLLSYVICKHDPQKDLQKVLSEYGVEEFHACEKMKDNNVMQKIRSSVRSHINNRTKWGVFVLPSNVRHKIFEDFSFFINTLKDMYPDQDVNIYVDQGIISNSEANLLSSEHNDLTVRNCDSSEVNGIQLADLAAALCGVRLREEMSGKTKTLTYGESSGFNPPIEADLGYELWASLRYSMHRKDKPVSDEDIATFKTTGYGYLISQKVSNDVYSKANKIFGEVYLGCIH